MADEIKNIETTDEVLAMKYLSIVFENDVTTVARVLASMGVELREELIDLAITKDMTDDLLTEVRTKFNEHLQLLKS